MAKKIDEGSYYEDDEIKQEEKRHDQQQQPSNKKFTLIACSILILIALIARLVYIFVFSDPDNPGAGWFGDSYHHWQIGYLTEQIGLSKGFLRVWDLKGMDLFWGLLHPLVLAFSFIITGNNSMGVERVITALAGSISVGIIFLLGKKYWNTTVGLMAALFTALCSVIIFNDATGMVEPLGIPFLLAGVYFWPKKAIISGICFGLALMTRSEYWMYSIGLVTLFTIWERTVHSDRKILLWLGLGIILIPYMKYLLDYTGNPMYPFYENFFKNIAGEWQYKTQLTPADLRGQFIFRIILGITTLAATYVLWKKPKGWQLHMLGLGNWLFLGLTFGVSHYIKSWADYVWVVRFMLFPYTYLGIIGAIILFEVLRNKVNNKIKPIYTTITVILFVGIIASTQLAWYEINKYYDPTHKTWTQVKEYASEIAMDYKGGVILMPEGNPDLTYALVRYHGVLGRDMVSQMYDPFFYFEEESLDPFANWNSTIPNDESGNTFRDEVLTWIKDNKITFLISYANRDRYNELIKREPAYFTYVRSIPNSNFAIYKVHYEKI